MGTARGPPADLAVVELTSTFLGPYCSLLLAQLGRGGPAGADPAAPHHPTGAPQAGPPA